MAIELSLAKKPKAKASAVQLPSLLAGLTQKKLDVTDRIFFTEQLSLMLEAGMPLFESLKAFSSLENKPQLNSILSSLMNDVEEGKSFSAALGAHPDFFLTGLYQPGGSSRKRRFSR